MRWTSCGGQVGDPAVQGEVHRRLLARGVDEPVGPGRAVPFHAAAAEPLVEPLQPAPAAAALQVDVVRVHHVLDRRIPAQDPLAVQGHHLDPHAPRRDQGDLDLAVVDPDQVDPVLLAAEEADLPHRPGDRAFGHGVPRDRHRAEDHVRVGVEVAADADQHLAIGFLRGGERRGGQDGDQAPAIREPGEVSHRSLLSLMR